MYGLGLCAHISSSLHLVSMRQDTKFNSSINICLRHPEYTVAFLSPRQLIIQTLRPGQFSGSLTNRKESKRKVWNLQRGVGVYSRFIQNNDHIRWHCHNDGWDKKKIFLKKESSETSGTNKHLFDMCRKNRESF
jgi:hypothetical protein